MLFKVGCQNRSSNEFYITAQQFYGAGSSCTTDFNYMVRKSKKDKESANLSHCSSN